MISLIKIANLIYSIPNESSLVDMLDEYRVTMGAKVNTVMLKNLKDSNQVWLFFFRFRGLNQTDNNVICNPK